MSVFAIRVNPIIGKKEWVSKPEHYDYYQEVARSSYADMLHDKERNEKYYMAIKKAIKYVKDQGRPAKVLDIGTGTGLLSMMAANSGADSITACEIFRPVAKCAQDVIKENGFADKIKVILKNSHDLTVGPDGDLKEKANILVAEVFDTELIGEGALKTFRQAINNLIEPDCIVIPSSASVYAQIIDSSLITRWNRLFPIHIDETKVILPPKNITSCPGSAAVHDLQMSQLPNDSFKRITDPICVFEFDFTGKKTIEMNETFIKQVPAINDGNCEVVFMWWELKMDMSGDIVLNNGPKWVQGMETHWRDHWMQAVYYLSDTINVMKGDKITLTAYHDEYSLWFSVPKSNNNKTIESPTCSCLVHVTDPHSRIGMKNDSVRNAKYVQLLKKHLTPSSVCLCISDGSLLPFIASKLGAKKVFTVETNHFHQSMIESYIDANSDCDNIKIIKKDATDLTFDDVEQEKIDIFISEPYFAECLHPWDILCFLHLRTVLNPLFDENAIFIPQQGMLRAVAIDFEHLWKIRAPVGHAEGFNLSKFDEMIQKAMSLSDSAVEPHPLWEYPCNALTESFDLLSFDFSKPILTDVLETTGDKLIAGRGTCNAVALWVDYKFQDCEITTGPVAPVNPNKAIEWYMNCQQGVYFIHPPVIVDDKNNHFLHYKVSFNLQTGNTSFDFVVEQKC